METSKIKPFFFFFYKKTTTVVPRKENKQIKMSLLRIKPEHGLTSSYRETPNLLALISISAKKNLFF